MFSIRNVTDTSSLLLILISGCCSIFVVTEIDLRSTSSKSQPSIEVDYYNKTAEITLKSNLSKTKTHEKIFCIKHSNNKRVRRNNVQQITVARTILPWDCHRDYVANNMNIENVILDVQSVSNNIIHKAIIRQGYLSNATYHTNWPQVFKNVLMYNVTITNVRINCPNPKVGPGTYKIKSILGVRGFNLAIRRFYLFRGIAEGGTIDCVQEVDKFQHGDVIPPIVTSKSPPEPTMPLGHIGFTIGYGSSGYYGVWRPPFWVNPYYPPQFPQVNNTATQLPTSVHYPPQFPQVNNIATQLPTSVHYPPQLPQGNSIPIQRSAAVHYPPQLRQVNSIPIQRYPSLVKYCQKPVSSYPFTHVPFPTIIPPDNLLPFNATYLPQEYYGCNKMYGPTGLFGPYSCYGPYGKMGPPPGINPYNSNGPYGPNGKWGIHGPYGPFGSYGAYGEFGPFGPYQNYKIPKPSGSVDPYGQHGFYGLSGPYGIKGQYGPFGPYGAYGTSGPPPGVNPYDLFGPYGPLGKYGPDGKFGPMGSSGVYGAQGPFGSAGPYGPHGLYGPFGPYGPYGPYGPPPGIDPFGPHGPYGPYGTHGIHGIFGPTGPYGAHGSLKPTGPVTFGNWTWGDHGWQPAGYKNLINLKINPRWPPPTYDPFYLPYCPCVKGHEHSYNLSSNLENILQCYKENKLSYLLEIKFPCPSISTERCSYPTTTPAHGKSCRTTIICIDTTCCKYITSTCFTTTPLCKTTKPCLPSILTCITSSVCVTTTPCHKTIPCITTKCLMTTCPTTCHTTTCPTTCTTTCLTSTCCITKCPCGASTCGKAKQFLPIKLLGQIKFDSNDMVARS